jgi:MFS family permease
VTPLRQNRDFVLLQTGQALSTLGSSASQIAYPLLVLAMTGSPAKAGVVGFASFAPYVLFGLFAGVAADRWNRKHVMIVMDLVRVLGMASIVVALALDELTFPQIALVALLEGSAFVFFNIAEVGALRSVVPGRQLPAAAAAEQARMSLVVLGGPPLGGVLFSIARGLPFLVDGISYVFSIVSLLWMRTPFQETRERDTTPVLAQIREGVSWLWGQKYLRTSALIFAGDNFVFQAIFLVFIVIAKRDGFSGGLIGVLIAMFGACSLLGSLAAPRAAKLLSIRTIMLLNQWLNGLFFLYVFFPSPYVLVGCVMPVAFVGPWLNSVIVGYRTAVTPDHLIGRVSSVARNLAFLGMPLGPLAAGLLLGVLSQKATVLVLALLCAALALVSTLSPSIRNAPSLAELDDLPTPVASPAGAD